LRRRRRHDWSGRRFGRGKRHTHGAISPLSEDDSDPVGGCRIEETAQHGLVQDPLCVLDVLQLGLLGPIRSLRDG
jgi:hypothetical protein